MSAATLEQQILEEDYNKMMQAKEAGKCMEIMINHFHRTLEPKTVELPDSATVRDLKRHLARIDFNGKAVCPPMHNRCMQRQASALCRGCIIATQ